MKPSEEGYVLLFAVFFLAILVLSLAVAAPQVAKSIQRDREMETFHRGMQYRRAVQLYYRSFQSYPPNLDALVKTNNVRFLRKKYIDPMTGKEDWKPILYGQNKAPVAMGFFGQPLAGGATSIVGTGPSGGNTPNGTTGGSAFGGSSFGGSSFGGSSFGGSSAGGSSIFGSSSDNGGSQTPTTGSSGTSATGSSGTGAGSTGTTSSGPGTGSGTSSSGSGSGGSGQTFGGAGIIGFEPASPKQSILIYKKKQHFNEWEFTYDPISDMQTMSGGNNGAIGQPASNTTTPVGGSGTGGSSSSFGSGSGFGLGSGSGLGSSPSPTPAPAPQETPAPQ